MRASRGVRVAAPCTVALAVALLGAGCEGDNLFEGGPPAGGTPQILQLQVSPDPVRGGDALDVRVEAQSLGRISSVTVGLRRAVVRDTVITVDPARTQVTQDLVFLLPEVLTDTLLIVQATVATEEGGVSEMVADTVRAADVSLPQVDVAVLRTPAGAGDTVGIAVTAADNVGLDDFGFVILTADGDTVDLVTAPAGARRDSADFAFVVPDTLPAAQLEVRGIARDLHGLEGRSEPATLEVTDVLVNAAEIVEPREGQRFPLGDSVEMVVRAADRSGVQQVELVGVALRGDADLGTGEEVVRFGPKTIAFPAAGADTLPTDTVVRRFLNAVPDTTREPVLLVARVTDAVDNVRSDTVGILVGGPRVVLLNPIDGQQVQSDRVLGVRVLAVDGAGITRVRITASGAVEETIVLDIAPAQDSVLADTAVAIPAGSTGTLRVSAEARNALDELGQSDTAAIEVVASGASDETPPSVRLELASEQRLELTDSIQVLVAAEDDPSGSGIARIGIAAIGDNGGVVTALSPRLTENFSPPRTGTVVRSFGFTPAGFIDPLALPDTVGFQVYAFAVDAEGNCAAAASASFQQLACDGGAFPGDTVAESATGMRADVVVVMGRTVRLPDGGTIADAQVDVPRGRLYLSNRDRNKVEVLDLAQFAFDATGVQVGSQPWGLALNAAGDTLIVANSGGTNISLVSLEGIPHEDGGRRIHTPNTVLFRVREENELGRIKYAGEFIDFSDLPMFITQDSRGRLLYSTLPTPSAPHASIRLVIEDPVPAASDDVPEVKFLFVDNALDESQDEVFSIAGVDSLVIHEGAAGGNDAARLFTHEPGYPGNVLASPILPLCAAADSLNELYEDVTGMPGPVFCNRGAWIPERVGLSDTTFVAPSGDRARVAFGEGGTDPAGRILIWDSEAFDGAGALSGGTAVADLVGNASERVNGLGLNVDGSLGVARGSEAAYFFTGTEVPAGQLRLAGRFSAGLADGGAGATLHPLHDDVNMSGEAAVAFVGTARRTLKAIDTFHFSEVGELHIRDNMVGPMRASLPLASDNAGVACPGPECVLLKLYGVTDSGGVVIVDVRAGDLES